MPSIVPPTLGATLRNLRGREGWTLRQMSAKTGIPVSSLSKIEHDRLSLTYEKLYQLGQRLGLRMSELFDESGDRADLPVTARRSLGSLDTALKVETPDHDYYYLCTELRQKRMIPVLAKIRASTSHQVQNLLHHAGEEYMYVLSGRVVVTTEFYDPVTLEEGQSIYIDSSMGHAYLVAEGCEEAQVLGVLSSSDQELMQQLLKIHAEQRATAIAADEITQSARRKRAR